MSTCIVYMTKHGCTAKTASMLRELLRDDVALFDLKEHAHPDIAPYDTVIVGGSIHAGKIQKGVRRFCEDERDSLLQKTLGLYICHMEEGETAEREFGEAYPAALRSHAAATGLFGGEFDFEKMNFVERTLVKRIAKVSRSVSRIDADAVRTFAEGLERARRGE